jgi:hypothetical protein
MRKFLGTWIAAAIMASVVPTARAADKPAVVKAPAAIPVVVCSNLNWSHGWLNHGGWGGWGYQDGLTIDGWPGNCSSLVGVGPYATRRVSPARIAPSADRATWGHRSLLPQESEAEAAEKK